MKTKEIEVWVDQAVLVDGTLEAFYTIATHLKDADEYEFPTIKARLIIEIPEQKVKVEITEQKIEITESQLEAAWKKYDCAPYNAAWKKHHYVAYSAAGFHDFKKALGFKSGDK